MNVPTFKARSRMLPASHGRHPNSHQREKTRHEDIAESRKGILTLGWLMNEEGHPAYWLKENARAGGQSTGDLLRIPASSMGTHTVIVAQSGAGKSFFLGRLIEELVLQTKGRCLVLDSNSDFVPIYTVESKGLWRNAKYDPKNRAGKLPTEVGRGEFLKAWSQVSIRIVGAEIKGDRDYWEKFQLWWPAISTEFLGEGLNPIERSSLYQCHSLVQCIAGLMQIEALRTKKEHASLIDTSEMLLRAILRQDEQRVDLQEHARSVIEKQFSGLIGHRASRLHDREDQESIPLIDAFVFGQPLLVQIRVELLIERAVAAARYISSRSADFYFAKARQLQAAGIIVDEPPSRSQKRIEVIDLPSIFEYSTRLLVVNSILAGELARAQLAREQAKTQGDKRVPTFVIVEEAHHFASSEPRNRAEKALRETFRTIAAEGRKYGLFLILVTQRPDKLDPLILSECENKALMRVDSKAILDIAKERMGLEYVSSDLAERCLAFGKGGVLLAGRWCKIPQIAYTCARRTKEGGRSLDASFWAVPY